MRGEATESGFQARCGAVALMTIGAGLDDDAYEAMEMLLAGELPGVLSGEVDEPWEGEEMLSVLDALRRWMSRRPRGTGRLGALMSEAGPSSGEALASLVCSWLATVTHALAAEPMTVVELERAIGRLDGAAIEAVLDSMEKTGQAEAMRYGEVTRYRLTDWMREGIGPIVAAVRHEGHFPDGLSAPPDVLDVEAAFQMALPLLRLPPRLSAAGRLGVRIPGEESLIAGAMVEVDRGAILASSPLLESEPENWVTGTPLEWCDTVIDPSEPMLEVGGDSALAGILIEALHEALFGGIEG